MRDLFNLPLPLYYSWWHNSRRDRTYINYCKINEYSIWNDDEKATRRCSKSTQIHTHTSNLSLAKRTESQITGNLAVQGNLNQVDTLRITGQYHAVDMHWLAVRDGGRSKPSFNLRCYRWRSCVTPTRVRLHLPRLSADCPDTSRLGRFRSAAWENASRIIRDTWFRIGCSRKCNSIRSYMR